MFDLVRAELIRVFKDKLFIILTIILSIYAVVSMLLYLGIGSIFQNMDQSSSMRDIFAAEEIALVNLSPFSNAGLVILILLLITFGKDYMQGTVRNKLIMGKSRSEVFFANVIVSVIIVLGTVLAFYLLSFAVALAFFNFGFKDPGLFFSKFLLILLGWATCAVAVAFLQAILKNPALGIVLLLVAGLGLTYAGQIVSVSGALIDPASNAAKVIRFLSYINIPYSSSMVLSMGGMGLDLGGTAVNMKELALLYSCSCVVFSGLFILLGYHVFQKREIK